MEHAIVRGDIRMLDDPLRAQSLSLIAGCVLAAIAVAVCAILAYLQPRGAIGSAPIVMVRESGALYVHVGDVVHPVANLASARLIAGTPAKPELVSASALNRVTRGALVGIPGAPDTIPAPLSSAESGWTVCEDATATTLVIGSAPANLDSGRSVLVAARGESAAATYLLYDGRRARVDLRNPAVVRALRLEGAVPRQVSRALLDGLPEAAEIRAPAVPRLGAPSPVQGYPIGTVFRVPRAGAGEYYLAVAGGVQRIGEVTADLIGFSQLGGHRGIVSVTPGVIGGVPVVDDVPVVEAPDRADIADDPVVCTRWSWSDAAAAPETAVLVGDSSPAGPVVELAQADGAGPGVDRVVVPGGKCAFVRASGVSGEGAATGTLYFVSDSGVIYGVHDEDAGNRLGLANPVPAPWPVLAHLPRGPALSVDAASVRRDSVALPPSSSR